ncbi:patatin-like phospholipase family protein [Rhodopseudomonas sp. HC1]|uniref:patatin-like phospholipase family protein n=1 Tax=Rhodopseudomonas infernalis TaxID=2897386 RepID=UPI001EE8AD82|nr:patatin-like phospholipase family protein [Rhodopseudomonas infernalis]MCG6203189.1 patatin-like phospholipase family protein [Rhodopseudomonas infernalis]
MTDSTITISSAAASPVDPRPDPKRAHVPSPPEEGIALCLSGGGYRAMVFHIGALWRLHETGYLQRLKRISSVSGGSITAGLLALKWRELSFATDTTLSEFVPKVVAPLRAFAGTTIDIGAILRGMLPGSSVGDEIAKAYDRELFRGASLQDLPETPRFVINATSVQSGALWRFSRLYMRDYRVGKVNRPKVEVAKAVAASSAFPPFLSPFRLALDPADFEPNTGDDLQRPPYTSQALLTDGGVYDNLGLETAWKRYTTILVSDAGGQMAPEEGPKTDWARHAYRVLNLVDNQVRALRKRQVIDSFEAKIRAGTYWGIRTNIADYGLGQHALVCPHDRTMKLADIATRLSAIDDLTQDRLINWGYAVCDAALRRWVDPKLTKPTDFPYPNAKV